MELQTAITQRRSIRSYLAKAVPEDLIQDIVAQATWAPSWGNTQPWQLHIVSGEPLVQLKEENVKALHTGVPVQPEIPNTQVWPGLMKNRYQDTGNILYTALDINKGDHEQQMAVPLKKVWIQGNLRFDLVPICQAI